ncbi:MAG TPA: AI-2E family transporter [Pirellulales bacterium]|jgi:predicted PurR-regulated permease PerM|nr:AI-2E family transporter [Pirellulales bacterium]
MTLSGDPLRAQPGTVVRTIQATLIVVGLALLVALLYYFEIVFFGLFIGIVLATILRAPIKWVEGRGCKHGTAVLLTFLVLLTVLVCALGLLVVPLSEQVSSLIASLPEFYEKMRGQLLASSSQLIRQLVEHLPRHAALNLDSAPVTPALSHFGDLFHALAMLVGVLLFAFYWSLQEQRTVRALLLLVPAWHRESSRELFEAMQAKVGSFVRGQSLLCLIIGVMTGTMYWLVGVEHALPLGIVAGLCEAVPTFGPSIGAIPAAMVAASQGTSALLGVAGTLALVHLAENLFLYPRIMDRAIGIHPVVTLLSLAAFTSLLGPPGAVLAILMAAIIQLVLDRFLLSRAAQEPAAPAGRDTISLLQHEAEELVRDVRLSLRTKEEVPTKQSDRVEEEIENLALEVEQLLLGQTPPPASLESTPVKA